MATRRKLSRKELKQPDEFQTVVETVSTFLELHLREVLLATGALIVIAAVVLGVYYYEARRARLAGERFAQALSQLEQRQYPAAEEALGRLAADESHRAVGRLANLYLASAYLAQKEPAKARDALRTYLDRGGDSIFRDTALNNLAVAYEQLGDYKQAADAYREAAKLAGPGQARAELGAARMLLKEGKRGDAIAAYRAFVSAHPFAAERESVRETLARLGVAPPGATPAPSVQLIKPASVPAR
ncbi:MAG TPA: tetratricopeptide repeat protein [Candidatus Binataceae bacterium]|nr:tetratricopeptide repeat protein [Candidatus Binataceae bacterium]